MTNEKPLAPTLLNIPHIQPINPTLASSLLGLVLQDVDGYLWAIDRDGSYLYFSTQVQEKVAAIFGLEIKVGDKALQALDGLSGATRYEWQKLYQQGFQGQSSRDVYEINIFGQVYFLDISINPVSGPGAEVIGVSCFARDVSEQVSKQKKLQAAEGRFQGLIENTHDGISLLAGDGKLSYVTPSVKRILGYEPNEVIGLDPSTLCHPEDQDTITAALQALIPRYGETITATYRMRHRNGTWRWLWANITNLLHEPAIHALVFNYKDITEKVVSDQKVATSEANLRSLFENTGTALVLLDQNFTVLSFNQKAVQWTRAEGLRQPAKGISYLCYVEESYRSRVLERLNAALQGEKVEYEAKGRARLGRQRWNSFSFRKISGKDGTTMGICLSVMDITDRKESEIIVRDSEALYRSLFNNSPLPKWVCEQSTLKYLEVNEKAVEHYGYTREQFLQMSAFDLREPCNQAELHDIIRDGNGKNYKSGMIEHVTKCGKKIFVEIAVHPILYKGINAFLVIAHDISETLRLQQLLMDEKINTQIEITRATIAAQEKERDEVAKELHDNVNQILATVKLYLDTYVQDKKEYEWLLPKASDTIVSAIEEIRKISKSLLPPHLTQLTLTASIEELGDHLRLAGMTVRFVSKVDEGKLSDPLKIAVYRIVQEQINNILKYSSAKTVIISLELHDHRLTLEILDDGIGFDTGKKRSGIGISNMKNRALTFNGQVDIDSAPGKGCRISALFCI